MIDEVYIDGTLNERLGVGMTKWWIAPLIIFPFKNVIIRRSSQKDR